MSSRLDLLFLGPPQVLLNQTPVATDRRKAIALLAYLAVDHRATRSFSRETLSALFWPDYEQAKAFTNLRRTIWEINQALGEDWLLADRESIQLNPDAKIYLDVARFRESIARSRQQKEPALRVEPLSEAASLYRDHFLSGFSLKDAPNFNEWAFGESEELRRQFAEVLTILSDDLCALGNAEAAIPSARRLVTLDPLNESSHRLLMKIYLEAGQHSAALKQYQTCEQILRKELGVDPQPETYALYKQIRQGKVKPTPATKPSAVTTRHNLPLQLSSFIGREGEQAEIRDLIAAQRLVTLTGAGGIGKTRLSLQVASTLLNEYPHGIWLVELAPLSDATLVPQAVATALDLSERTDLPSLNLVTNFLQSKRALLVLDNCEHLIEACAQFVEVLLRACPDLHILASSREALGLAGETIYLVPSLRTPVPTQVKIESLAEYEAVQLFIERARAALPGFSLTDQNGPAVLQICYQLDGIPLALELAAARIKMLSAEEIAARLHDRFHLLTGGTRTALPRHQTLHALIDWSHSLLSEPERILLRRLSIFAGGWTLEAAESICAGQDIQLHEILDLLAQLYNKSLILAERKTGQETRYLMLETIRQYGREKLWEAGEGNALRQKHLAYFVELAEDAEPNLRGFEMGLWLDHLDAEYGNIRAALEWSLESDIESQLRLSSALLWFWHIHHHQNEGLDWVERGLSIESMERGKQPLSAERALIRGKALHASGFLQAMIFETNKASERLEESLELFRGLGEAGKRGMANALLRLGGLQAPGDRETMLQQSLTLFRELGDKFGIAESLMNLTDIAQRADNYTQEAVNLVEEHLALRREIGDQDGIAIALVQLGSLVFWQGDHERAIALFEEGLANFRALENTGGMNYALSAYAADLLWLGDYERVSKTFEGSLVFALETGDRFLITFCHYSMGFIKWFQDELDEAIALFKEGLALSEEMGNPWFMTNSLHALGDIALAQGDVQGAINYYEEELAIARQKHHDTNLAFTRGSLAKVAWIRGQYDEAVKQFEEALQMSQAVDFRPGIFHALYGLGRVAYSQGDLTRARAAYEEILKVQYRQINVLFYWLWLTTYGHSIAYPLDGLAALAVDEKQMERAARLLGAAAGLYPPFYFEMSARERAEHDRVIAAVRAALGEQTFSAAYEEGKKMTIDQAAKYGLEKA